MYYGQLENSQLELSALWGTGACSIDLLGAFLGAGCEER